MNRTLSVRSPHVLRSQCPISSMSDLLSRRAPFILSWPSFHEIVAHLHPFHSSRSLPAHSNLDATRLSIFDDARRFAAQLSSLQQIKICRSVPVHCPPGCQLTAFPLSLSFLFSVSRTGSGDQKFSDVAKTTAPRAPRARAAEPAIPRTRARQTDSRRELTRVNVHQRAMVDQFVVST